MQLMATFLRKNVYNDSHFTQIRIFVKLFPGIPEISALFRFSGLLVFVVIGTRRGTAPCLTLKGKTWRGTGPRPTECGWFSGMPKTPQKQKSAANRQVYAY